MNLSKDKKVQRTEHSTASRSVPRARISLFFFFFSFLSFSRPLSHARSLSFTPSILCLFNSFPLVRGQFPRLSADAGRLSLGNLYYLFF